MHVYSLFCIYNIYLIFDFLFEAVTLGYFALKLLIIL